MAVSIGPVIGIKGEKEFRATLKEIIAETQKYSAEMDKLTASFDKNDSALTRNAKKHELLKTEIEKQSKVVEQNTKLRDEAQAKLAKDHTLLEKQKELVSSLSKEYEQEKKKVDELKKALGESDPTVQKATASLEDQKKVLTEETQKLDDMNVAIHRSGEVLETWETKVIQSQAELERLNREFENTKPIKAWAEQFEDWGGKLEEFGDMMTKYVSAPLAALGTYATKAALDFEDGMAKIYTIAIDGTKPMQEMHDELMQLSAETGFGLDDLTEATYQTVSASVDAADAMEFMAQATKLARAGFTTTEKSVDVLTTIMNSYGKETYDAAYISDVLLKTQNDGKLVIDELASSLGIIIPMASNYNVGLEQIAAAYATMTKQGVPAQKATTFLRAVFTELEKESSDVAEILETKTGKSFAQLMKDGNSLSDVLRILYNEVGGDAEQFQRLFGNVRATQAVASLVTDDFKILDYELERVTHSAGQTDKALEVMETTSLKAKRSVAQLKNGAVALGEGILEWAMPAFEKLTNKVKDLTDKFTALSPEAVGIIAKMGAFAVALAPVAKITGVIIKYIAGLVLGTSSLIPIIGLVTAGVIGVATAIATSNQAHIDAIKAEYGLSDAMKDELAELDALKASHDEFRQSMVDKNTATLNEVAYMQELASQYDALVGKNGEVSEANKATADFILGELASALGLEVSQVKALIDENGKLSASIADNIEKYKQEAFAATLKEEIREATQRKVEAERIEADIIDQLAIATENQRRATNEREAAQEAINKAIADGNPVTKEMSDRLADATTAEKLAKDATWELRSGLADAQEQISGASKDIDYYSDRLNNLENESKKTADQIEKDAKRASGAVDTASDDVGVSLSYAASVAYTHGENVARGFAKGISDYAYLSAQAADSMGGSATRRLQNKLAIASPSKVTAEIGKYFVEGFAKPIESSMREIGNLTAQLGEVATEGLAFGSYMPEYGNTYNNKTVSAPIAINLTVNGNVDDPQSFARDIADMLANQLTRESEVFA